MTRVSRSLPPLFIAAGIVMAIAQSRDAHAGESVRLAYVRGEGAADCADEKGLRLGVAVRLGYDPFVGWAPKTVHADIARDGARLRARVSLAGEDGRAQGTRVLFAPQGDCDKLLAAVALAVSIAIDPMSSGAPESAPPVESKKAFDPPPAVPTPTPATPAVDARPIASDRGGEVEAARRDVPSSSWTAALGLGSVLSTGTSPDLAVGVAASLRAVSPSASLAVEGRYQFPDSRVADVGRGTVDSSLLLVALEPCWRLSPVSLCALATIGSLRGAGAGISMPKDGSTFYWGAGGRVAVEVPLTAPLSLRGHLDLVGNGTRAVLYLDDREVWRVSALSAAAGVDVVARIW